MGADHGFHHGSDDVVRRVRELTGVGCDVVVDCVGESTWDRSLRCLRPMGRLVTCGATSGPQVGLDLRRLFWFQWSLLGSTMGNDAEFAEIVRLARSGELRPVVDSIIPLDRAPLALARMDAGAQFGKLVIEVAHE